MSKVSNSKNEESLDKQLERVKLKQKLLIDSIKSKVSKEQQESLVELNSKIDFLVKVFSQIKSHEEESKKEFMIFTEEIKNHLEEISQNLEISMKSMKKEIKKELLEELSQKEEPNRVVSQKYDLETNQNEMPPLPDFNIDRS